MSTTGSMLVTAADSLGLAGLIIVAEVCRPLQEGEAQGIFANRRLGDLI